MTLRNNIGLITTMIIAKTYLLVLMLSAVVIDRCDLLWNINML